MSIKGIDKLDTGRVLRAVMCAFTAAFLIGALFAPDVKEIFTDIGLRAPLLLVGTEAAFDTVEEVARKRMAEAMNKMEIPKASKEFTEGPDEDDDLPFS